MRKVLVILTMCLALTVSAMAQLTVTGRVTGDDGLGIPGASVLERGTTNGTVTNFDGVYSLRVGNNATLVFSFMGYTPQEIPVQGRTSINVTLLVSSLTVDEVVVTAMGISRERKALGYAMSTIQSTELTKVSPTNFGSALYGKAPGLRIQTAPGGATSAVNINIRGVNSITGRSQPLIVVNGMPIRDGEVRNNDYWNDQRIRGNGLLDINPEDIESISILKGASAAALYGSEAVNGVVLITTKSGKGVKGFKVDVNSSYSVDNIAYMPRFQNVRGPGYPKTFANAGQDDDGWLYYDSNGDGNRDARMIVYTNVNFGPKFDGKPTIGWDGVIRPYEAQEKNYAGLYQQAVNAATTVALSIGGENSNSRISLTRQDNEGVSLFSKNERNIANINSTFYLGKKYTVDVVINYINQYTKNRPFSTDRMINNFGGMMPRFDNAQWYLNKYQTSLGYKYVTGTNQSLTPNENIRVNGVRTDIADYVWTLHKRQSEEFSNRIIANLTNTWQIFDDLKLRGRIATDITTEKSEEFEHNTVPLAFGNSGWFSMGSFNSSVLYGDVLLTYNKKLTSDLELSATAGYTAQKDEVTRLGRSTNGGLSTENLFDLAATTNTANSSSSRQYLVKDAILGTVNLNFRTFLFAEATVRRDRTSTMHPDNNAFVYPSVNTSFIFSEALTMPQFINFGKLRASWGVVGNYPDIYGANIAYNQNTLGVQAVGGRPVLFTTLPMAFGNDGIKPEEKNEIEFGLEMRFLNHRLGFDLAYYNGEIRDQILPLTLPSSMGATSVLTNIGTMRNKGIELAITGTPVQTAFFKWNTILNVSNNVNVIEKLTDGASELLHADYDGSAAQLRSVVGQAMGDLYARPVVQVNGQPMVDTNGLYRVDPDNWIKVGNAMPKAVGGLINSFSYKNFTLDAVLDFRYGGHVMPTGMNWMISRGLTEESLQWMDKENGGLSYYIADGKRIRTDASAGPNGEKVYDDGLILPGVKLDGSPNDFIATNMDYWLRNYGWGGPQYSPWTRYELYIKENNYVKMREVSLSYNLPKNVVSKLGMNNIQISAFGRNLFFVYRTLKDMDPEQLTAGSRWFQQINNAGTNPATRTIGGSLRFSF
jgi:iron complex outermembrane recepter protein